MKTFKELRESIDHLGHRYHQARNVFNQRAKQASQAWSKTRSETDPEYQKAAEKAAKSSLTVGKYTKKIIDRRNAQQAAKTPEQKAEIEKAARGYGSGKYQGD